MTPPKITILALLFALSLSAIGCGGDDGPPGFMLQVRLMSIVVPAVHQLEIRFQAREGQHFEVTPPATYEGGAIETHVTAEGDYLITIQNSWLAPRASPDAALLGGWVIPVELASIGTSTVDAMDPAIVTHVVRNGEVIGEDMRFIQWPLVSGGSMQVPVACRAGFHYQCTNNDAPDSGVAEGDGG